ncbi:hypothetical protein M9458_039892, partial [Cirrhinus mrigala]
LSTFRPPSVPSLASSTKRPVSVHEEALLRQLNPKQQLKEDICRLWVYELWLSISRNSSCCTSRLGTKLTCLDSIR